MLLAATKAGTIQNVLSIAASRNAKTKRRMRREVSHPFCSGVAKTLLNESLSVTAIGPAETLVPKLGWLGE
jgi:hypothetical protein